MATNASAAEKKLLGEVTIFGISPDSVDRQQRFADKTGAPFSLLADLDHKVADKYGVWGPKKLYGKEYEGITRSAFLIGPTSRIQGVWPKIKPVDTPVRLLESLAEAPGA